MAGVHFDPPLNLQRQAWVLSQLKKFKAESILEVGCCTAPLLQAVLPAPLYVFPNAEWKTKVKKATNIENHEIFHPDTVAPKKVVILDVDDKSLEEPITVLSSQQSIRASRRWHDLQVKVICGNLVDNFKELVGEVDVAVATEVIEHLPEDELAQFAPCILGNYRPTVLLISTPNYSFNSKFGQKEEYSDPTKRTERVFRHSDHKFEWTTTEFKKWCDSIADSHEYEVTVSGLGQSLLELRDKEESAGNEDDKYATQTAVFTRRCSESEKKGSAATTPASKPKFDLDFHFHAGREGEEDSDGSDVIGTTIDAIIDFGSMLESSNDFQIYEARLWDVWMDEAVQRSCHGRLDHWLDVLGVTFEGDTWYCSGEVSLLVKNEDLILSCRLQGDDMIPAIIEEGSDDSYSE